MAKSVNKKVERLQEQMAQKFKVDGQNPLTAGWMFNAWYEKVILFALFILGSWKLFELVFL